MRYELINNNIENKKVLDIVLNNRNINNDQVKKLLNANEFENPFKLYGINEAVKQFKQEILKNNNILIISDSDVDGMCSSTMFYRFLIEDIKYDKNKVSYNIHEGKKNGITNEVIEHIKKIMNQEDGLLIEYFQRLMIEDIFLGYRQNDTQKNRL